MKTLLLSFFVSFVATANAHAVYNGPVQGKQVEYTADLAVQSATNHYAGVTAARIVKSTETVYPAGFEYHHRQPAHPVVIESYTLQLFAANGEAVTVELKPLSQQVDACGSIHTRLGNKATEGLVTLHSETYTIVDHGYRQCEDRLMDVVQLSANYFDSRTGSSHLKALGRKAVLYYIQ